ncbi:MAG: ribose-phosphate diphosphokinase [Kiritimatiellae bacterium]|nr:ribose-phosphate diphosphokinase [Kiritimatiellia bacterium]
MFIFTGNAHRKLAEEIAKSVGIPLGKVEIKRFPDGEIFVQIMENIRGRDVFIVQPTCYPSNENIMELLIMIDAARRASPSRITAVLPYYGYARQDRKDQPRVPISAKLVANLLVAAGTHRLLTMDLHAQQIQGFFDIPVDHLYAAPILVKYLRAQQLSDVSIVAPDPGGLKMAHAYSTLLGAGLAIVAKQRKSATEVEALNLVGDVKGCNCVIVDDLTSTAGTLCEAARILEEHGAKKIYAAVTHALISDSGIERLKASPIEKLVTTNSVPRNDWHDGPVEVLSVAKLLGKAIMRIRNNQSVSSLFKI